MTNKTVDLDTLQTTVDLDTLLEAAKNGKLRNHTWGDGRETFCMMSALVPGAMSHAHCIVRGWPEWLVSLNIHLYDHGSREGAIPFAIAVGTLCKEMVQKGYGWGSVRDKYIQKVLNLVAVEVRRKSDNARLLKLFEETRDNFNKGTPIEESVDILKEVRTNAAYCRGKNYDIRGVIHSALRHEADMLPYWYRVITGIAPEAVADNHRNILIESFMEVLS